MAGLHTPLTSTGRLAAARVRRRLEIRGRVQGVGFRPFVYRLATQLGLTGHVANDSLGAVIEIEGEPARLDRFTSDLQHELPPLAGITDLTVTAVPVLGSDAFVIEDSVTGQNQEAQITPDAAVCPDCLRELFDTNDRRYRYPFINCTNCGPRYSIIRAVPYDRPNTTMSCFRMCPKCQAEYDDPADRRFHAQPNACRSCGPTVWLTDSRGNRMEGDAIRLAARQLAEGQIVAIKGIGGFHLACRADDDGAVERLRSRKARESKPFALMVPSMDAARALTELSREAAAAMESVERPIVLAPRLSVAAVSRHVAPGNECLGIMLPYTPLHHLLFAENLGPLVMTSGNPSEEPLCCENAEALQRLADIADAFLLHDRDIQRRVDDSVVLSVTAPTAHTMPVRRARGYAPAPVRISRHATRPVLAVGGELKSTVCILSGNEAVLSEHLGDLSNVAAYRNFVETIEQFQGLLRIKPFVVAHDLHPAYIATRYARRLGLDMVGVQHHHAHVVSCMADCGISGRVIGVSCDGTGYGTDGAIWGCEVLEADEAGFTRAAHLRYFPLLGGDAAAHETWRPAAGLLHETFGPDWQQRMPSRSGKLCRESLAMADRKLSSSSSRLVRCSSLGRLFDAVAFLLGICECNQHEAQAAMLLEATAREHTGDAPLLPYDVIVPDAAAPLQLDPRPMLRELVASVGDLQSVRQLARSFHETVAAMLTAAVQRVAAQSGLTRVVLSGGCFANRLLTECIARRLAMSGLELYTHRRVPPGDGGLSLGQAVVAAELSGRTT